MRVGKFLTEDQNGSAIVLAILILVVVSIIGIEASNTSSLEATIATADRDAKINFYRAEAAGMEAAQRVENAIANALRSRADAWLNGDTIDLEDTSVWTNLTSATSTVDNNAFYAVMDSGVSGRTSLDMTQPSRLHTFRVFGRFAANNQGAFIEMGYRKRF